MNLFSKHAKGITLKESICSKEDDTRREKNGYFPLNQYFSAYARPRSEVSCLVLWLKFPYDLTGETFVPLPEPSNI